ncbi:uncharacterized protein LOC121181334 [Toxotes jaculatrix]|uniref:uncharacterized protein LOC121181334 n=1 Tax=Toxotes jaculatrix TaxID=941984 RepID=UPI001B3AFB64|nr:uncharacterized protein LOC121181334 [Toxotes jaculatrix]
MLSHHIKRYRKHCLLHYSDCIYVRDENSICVQCCKMMLLCWSTLLLCLSVNAANNLVWREPGGNVTLECSFEKCPSIDKFFGMYLYHEIDEKEEVLFYVNSEKVTPRLRYSERVKTKGIFKNHTITIRDLTVEDSGIYSCVYKKNSDSEVKCNVYLLLISEVVQCSIPKEDHVSERCTLPVLIIVVTCSIGTVAVIISILLIMMMRKWTGRRPRNVPQTSNDYVYEVMTKNGLRPLGSQE